MRVLLKATMPVEIGNKAVSDGTLGKTIQSILEEQKPEAAYFTAEGGQRTAHIFLDLKNASDLPGAAEPWFQAFNAKVEVIPAMSVQDLAVAMPGIEAAVRKYSAQSRGASAD